LTIFIIISILLLLPYIILILYYWQSWLKIKEYDVADKKVIGEGVSISVIIPARNEEKNIGNCLRSIINQTYSENLFEIIVIDDHSTDQTVEVANSFGKDNIRVIKLADIMGNSTLNSYKKKAVETGVNMAHGNLIVTTDADCVAQPKWLQTIASFYNTSGAVFIAAPVNYFSALPNDSSLKKIFKIFQSLDFMTLQGITGASVSKKIHNMCNGANLAYEKKVFYEVNGFEGIDSIASGDDMLLMHKIQKRYPDKIGFLKSRDAIVKTAAAETLADFLNQRIRWASKADKYPDIKITTVLLLVYLFNGWILLTGIYAFISVQALYLLLTLLACKTIVELIFLYPVAWFFKNQSLLWWFIPAQPFHVIYTVIAGWLGKFGTYTWKGRKVK
jgi:cellulose synthase/poly-beta-1,6-N-acetylglucosamine synthase-like glycosyltransferase